MARAGELGYGVEQTPRYEAIQPVVKRDRGSELLSMIGAGVQTYAKVVGMKKEDEAKTLKASEKKARAKQLAIEKAVQSSEGRQQAFLHQQEDLNEANENGLEGDARSLFLQDKLNARLEAVRKQGQDIDVNFFKSYASHYAKLGESSVKKATLAGDKNETIFQNNKQTTDFTASILSGEGINYDEITLVGKGKVNNSDIKGNVYNAINNAISLKASEITTQEDLDEFKIWASNIMKEYNANKYLGGSSSAKAIDLQTKINKTLQATISSHGASIAKEYTDYISNEADLGEMNPKLLNQKIDNHPAWTKHKKEQKKRSYREVYEKKKKTNNQVADFNPFQDNNALYASNELTEEATRTTKKMVVDSLKGSIEQGLIAQAIDLTLSNKSTALPAMKAMLDMSPDEEVSNKRLELYARIKASKDGNKLLNNIDSKQRGFYDLLEFKRHILGEEVNISELYDLVTSEDSANWDKDDIADFRKMSKSLPKKLQDGLFSYASILLKSGQDFSDVEARIEELVESNTREIQTSGWGFIGGNTAKLINFDKTPLAGATDEEAIDVLNGTILDKDFKIEDQTIVYDEKNEDIVIYSKDDSLVPLAVIEKDVLNKEFKEYSLIKGFEADIERAENKSTKENMKKLREKVESLPDEVFRLPFTNDFTKKVFKKYFGGEKEDIPSTVDSIKSWFSDKLDNINDNLEQSGDISKEPVPASEKEETMKEEETIDDRLDRIEGALKEEVEKEEEFYEVLKKAENAGQTGRSFLTSKWTPHESPEGGNKTIGYGHKLTNAESKENYVVINSKKVPLKGGLTDGQIDALFKQDIANSEKIAKSLFDEKYPNVWKTLNRKTQLLAAEIQFNVKGGLQGFPTFMKLASNPDTEDKALNEIGRTYKNKQGKIVPLKNRTDAIKEWYKG